MKKSEVNFKHLVLEYSRKYILGKFLSVTKVCFSLHDGVALMSSVCIPHLV